MSSLCNLVLLDAYTLTSVAGAEYGSRVWQFALNVYCERVRSAEHAPEDPFRLLERRHGLAEIVERRIGWSIVLRGIYMGSLILGASRQDSMGFTFVAAALNGLRFALFDAETIGASKYSRIYFVAFPLLVAAASFATLEPSELLSP